MAYEIGQGYVPTTPQQPFNMMADAGIEQPTNIFSRTAGTTPTGNIDTVNPAATQAASSAIGTAAQVGSSVIQGVAQFNQNERAQQEARDIDNQNRTDALKQQSVNNAQQTRAKELEEKQFAFKKRKDAFNIKLNTFIQNVTNDINNRQDFQNNADQMFGSMIKNEQMKNMIVQMAKGEV